MSNSHIPRVIQPIRRNTHPPPIVKSDEEQRRDKVDAILHLVRTRRETETQNVHFLVGILTDYANQFPGWMDGLYKATLMPVLVNYLKYFIQTVPLLRAHFDDITPPPFDAAGLARVMRAVYGQHRLAVRYFLNALTQYDTPPQGARGRLCTTLQQIVTLDPAQDRDPDCVGASYDVRERATLELIACRDDIPTARIFAILIDTVNSLKFPEMTRTYNETIEVVLVALAQNLVQFDMQSGTDVLQAIRHKNSNPDEIQATDASRLPKRYVIAQRLEMPLPDPSNHSEHPPLFADPFSHTREHDIREHDTHDTHELAGDLRALLLRIEGRV